MSRYWVAGVAVGLVVGYAVAWKREFRRGYDLACEDCRQFGMAYPTGHPSRVGLYGRKETVDGNAVR